MLTRWSQFRYGFTSALWPGSMDWEQAGVATGVLVWLVFFLGVGTLLGTTMRVPHA